MARRIIFNFLKFEHSYTTIYLFDAFATPASPSEQRRVPIAPILLSNLAFVFR